jgi:hypothetical protein
MMGVINNAKYPSILENCVALQFLGSVMEAMKQIVTSNASYKERKKSLKKIVCDEYLQNVIKDLNVNNEKITYKIFVKVLKMKFTLLTYILVKAKC